MPLLRIASLDCEIPVPNVLAERGTFSVLFDDLLKNSAKTELGDVGRELDIKLSRYNCKIGELPSVEELEDIDGIIITGSASSAYDDVPWIKELLTFCHNLYYNHPRIKIFGSCFGHQLFSHAVFTPIVSSPVVSKDPAGWELGIQTITLNTSFLKTFGPVLSNPTSSSQLRLQFIHADHVVLPPPLLTQEGFESIGRSEHCSLQGIWKKGRVLTYQGHAEFDPFVNGELVKVFGQGIWSKEHIDEVLTWVHNGDDDAVWAGGVILKFFLGLDGDSDDDESNASCSSKEFEDSGSGSSSGREL